MKGVCAQRRRIWRSEARLQCFEDDNLFSHVSEDVSMDLEEVWDEATRSQLANEEEHACAGAALHTTLNPLATTRDTSTDDESWSVISGECAPSLCLPSCTWSECSSREDEDVWSLVDEVEVANELHHATGESQAMEPQPSSRETEDCVDDYAIAQAVWEEEQAILNAAANVFSRTNTSSMALGKRPRLVTPTAKALVDAQRFSECCICAANLATVACEPCGHVTLCAACHARWQRDDPRCVYCRTEVVDSFNLLGAPRAVCTTRGAIEAAALEPEDEDVATYPRAGQRAQPAPSSYYMRDTLPAAAWRRAMAASPHGEWTKRSMRLAHREVNRLRKQGTGTQYATRVHVDRRTAGRHGERAALKRRQALEHLAQYGSESAIRKLVHRYGLAEATRVSGWQSALSLFNAPRRLGLATADCYLRAAPEASGVALPRLGAQQLYAVRIGMASAVGVSLRHNFHSSVRGGWYGGVGRGRGGQPFRRDGTAGSELAEAKSALKRKAESQRAQRIAQRLERAAAAVRKEARHAEAIAHVDAAAARVELLAAEPRTCSLCDHRDASMLAVPCGHMGLCSECWHERCKASWARSCSVCKASTKVTIRIFSH